MNELLLALSRAIGRDHKEAAMQTLQNRPPVLNIPLEDFSINAGEQSQLQFSAGTFVDADVGDALRYRAYGTHSDALPSWIKFDALHRRFVFKPPPENSGSLQIRVVARDFDGLEAESCFMLMWSS